MFITKNRFKYILPLLALIIVLAIIFIYNLNNASALETALKWSRLNPIPISAKNLSIQTAGSIFSREFEIKFSDDSDNIMLWLEGSPGTKDIKSEKISENQVRYVITPGEGAQYAEIVFNNKTQEVVIRTYWS